jgi:hypothetical protein
MRNTLRGAAASSRPNNSRHIFDPTAPASLTGIGTVTPTRDSYFSVAARDRLICRLNTYFAARHDRVGSVVKRGNQHCAFTAGGKRTGDFRPRIEAAPAIPAKGCAS